MKKIYQSKVVKLSSDKTVKVEILLSYTHQLYRKIIRRHKTLLVHNLLPDIQVGDNVLIQECRPISKLKHFYIKKKINNTQNDTTTNSTKS